MDPEFSRLGNLQQLMEAHGRDLIAGLLVLILGLLAVRFIIRGFRRLLETVVKNPAIVATATNVVHIILLSVVIIAAAVEAGFKVQPIFRLVMVFLLSLIGIVVLFRPYMPTLPFKVGQTIKATGLLGKVEGTTVLNTRIRTFDGKVFFVPNKTILNDTIINYHYTPTRRMKLDIPIRYDQDLMKAKKVLEALMIEDPRVLTSPRPTVWVLDLSNGCVMIGGRCWADNLKYWQTRVDLLEKAKLRFDREGILISYPHIGVHHHPAETEDGEVSLKAAPAPADAAPAEPVEEG
jgi:small conductance mechanosensitive channel